MYSDAYYHDYEQYNFLRSDINYNTSEVIKEFQWYGLPYANWTCYKCSKILTLTSEVIKEFQ